MIKMKANSLKSVTSVIILLVSIGTILVTSCKNTGDKPAGAGVTDTVAVAPSGQAEGGAGAMVADPGSNKVTITEGAEWSEEIPAEFPEFTYGTIHHMSITHNPDAITYDMYYQGVTLDIIDKYEAELQAKGFKTKKQTMKNRGMMAAERAEGYVNMMMDDRLCQISVTVRK